MCGTGVIPVVPRCPLVSVVTAPLKALSESPVHLGTSDPIGVFFQISLLFKGRYIRTLTCFAPAGVV